MSEEKKEEIKGDFGGFSLLKDDTSIIDQMSIETPAVKDDEKEDVLDKAEDKAEDKPEPEKKESKPVSKKKEDIKEQVIEDEEEPTEEPAEEEEEEQEDEPTEEPIEEEEEEEEPEGSFKPFVEHLADKGILDYDAEEEFDDSEEGLETIVSKTVENGINSYKNSIPEDGQKFLEFLENGGKAADFHKYYYGESSFEDFPIETEENQKYAYAEGLRVEGYTEEEIADEIQDAIDLGKLEKKAEIHLKKLQRLEAKNKENLLEVQKKAAEEQRKRQEAEWKAFKDGLYEAETIAGFKLSKKEKDETWEYMTAPIDKKTGETQYNADMPEKGAQARYLMAFLMKNNFDISKLEKKVQTKEVRKLRKKLGNFTDSRSKMKTGKPPKQESNQDNDFSKFREAL